MAVPYKLNYFEIETGIDSTSTFIHTGDLTATKVKKYLATSNDILLGDGTTTSLSGLQPAGNYITALTGEATATGPGSVAITLTNSAVIGKVLTGLSITGSAIASTDTILQAFGKIQNQINGKQNTLTLTTTGSSGSSTFIADVLNVPTYTLSGLGGVPTSRQLTINGTAYDLSADRSWSVGTVTSVAALTLGTTGTDLSSTVANSTTTPVITLNVPTASATNRGALSSADWTTFNSKQDAITLTTTGSSGASTFISNTLNVPTYTLSGLGGVPTTRTITINGTSQDLSADRTYNVGTVTSVGLTMPAAFSIANSPVTSAGTIAITGAGLASQYIRGDGALADFPNTGGGGSSVSYYLNGSVSQGTIGGNAYYEMNKTPVIGTGTDFTINANGYIAQFITDANDPASLLIPAGNWNVEMYFSASSSGGTPSFYVEVYKYNGTTFTLLGSSSATPEGITNGTAIDIYYTSVGIPETVLTITDRLAIRVYVTHSGRTITLHTEDNHLSEIVTTFSNGLTALNGLTKQTQYFATGTTGTDFNISSSVDTHTFNIPSASASNRGVITTGAQTIAGAKTLTGALVGTTANFTGQLTLGSTITNGTYTYTLPSATGTLALVGGAGVGTVTSVAALTLGTSGTDLSSTVANSTTTPVITLNVPTASASNRGALSAADWTTFNSKQGTITLTTTGTSGAATFIANTLNIPNYADGGVLSLSAIGATPNANAATITGTVLNLQPASASFGGVITTGTQTIAGDKTFTGNINASPTSGNAIQAITTSSVAIQVQSTTGDGVQASSTTGAAIKGTASGALGSGVVGQASGTGGAGGYFLGSGIGYAVLAEATGASTTALYGTANSASFPVQRLIQSGAGSIALFDNSGGTVATITNAGGLTLSALLTGATATFTNSGSGIGVGVTNSGSGDGIKITHSLGRAFRIESSSTGYGILINNLTASTSAPFTIQKQGSTVITMSDTGAANFTGQLTLGSTITNGTYTYTLPSATGTLALTSAIPANPVGGTGTTNYLPKFTGTSTIGNSIVQETGSSISVAGSINISGNFPIILNSVSGATSQQLQYQNNGTNKWQLYLETSNNSFNFFSSANSANKLTLTEAGNLGLGVTPSAWYSTFQAFQFGANGSSVFGRSENNMAAFASNAYVNSAGNFIYINTNYASYYQQLNSQHQWYNAPSGTAGNAISFTQAMTLFSDGNLLLTNGTVSNAGYKLDVNGTGRFTAPSGTQENITVKSANTGFSKIVIDAVTSASSQLAFLENGSQKGVVGYRPSTGNVFLANATGDILTIASTGAATFSSSVFVGSSITSVATLHANNTSSADPTSLSSVPTTNVFGMSTSPGAMLAAGIGTTGGSHIWLQGRNTGGAGVSYPISLQPLGGNVGIGTTTPQGGGGATDKTLSINSGSGAASFVTGLVGDVKYSTLFTSSSIVVLETNTAIPLAFNTNGTERMRITPAGNVGIGTTDPDFGSFGAGEKILGISNSSARARLSFQNTATGTTGVSGTLAFFNLTTLLASIDVIADGATNKGKYVFNTNNGTSNSARLTISNTGEATFSSLGTGTVTATSGTLSTVSDSAFKVDAGFIDSALDKVMNLKPRYFYWNNKSGLPEDVKQLGFYAQEVNKALGEEAAQTPATEDIPWGISDRSVIAMLTKAIQELKAEIDLLKGEPIIPTDNNLE